LTKLGWAKDFKYNNFRLSCGLKQVQDDIYFLRKDLFLAKNSFDLKPPSAKMAREKKSQGGKIFGG
jgi:hypothetical protein